MGIKRAEFFRMTPLDFARHSRAYQRRREMELLPFRRLETAIWNVQIAKTENGKQLAQTDIFPLSMDSLPSLKRSREKPEKPNGIMSREQYMKLIEAQNKPKES